MWAIIRGFFAAVNPVYSFTREETLESLLRPFLYFNLAAIGYILLPVAM
jgi:hypothetical protein